MTRGAAESRRDAHAKLQLANQQAAGRRFKYLMQQSGLFEFFKACFEQGNLQAATQFAIRIREVELRLDAFIAMLRASEPLLRCASTLMRQWSYTAQELHLPSERVGWGYQEWCDFAAQERHTRGHDRAAAILTITIVPHLCACVLISTCPALCSPYCDAMLPPALYSLA